MYLIGPVAVLVLSFFMPYFRLGRIGGASGLDLIGDGGSALLLLLGAVLMGAATFMPKLKAKFGNPYDKVYLGGAALTTFYFVLVILRRSDAVRVLRDASLDFIGVGAWVGLISGLAGIYLGITYKKLR